MRAVALLALFVVGCSSASVSRPVQGLPSLPPAVHTEDAPTADAIVVTAEGSIELSAEGKALASSDVERLAIGDRILSANKTRKTGTFSCDVDFGGNPVHRDGEYEGQSLAFSERNGHSQLAVKMYEQETEANAMEVQKDKVEITGIVGPYVFIRRSGTFFACGAAHPMGGVSALVWDTEHQKEVTFEAPTAVWTAATDQLKDRGWGELMVGEATPKFDDSGRLTIEWRLMKPTAYSESDGLGSAYSVSTFVESSDLPAQLRAYREAPLSVQKYAARSAEPIRGWSRITVEPR